MTFLERYLNGEREKVYEEIYDLGLAELNPIQKEDINSVLDETFRRVRHNLIEIHKGLRNRNYQFLADSYEEANKPLVLSTGDGDIQIKKIEQEIEPFVLPLSLKYFYKYISNCDFTWDWKKSPEILWEGSDPLVINSLDEINASGFGELNISPDDLMKDNISGDAYYLELEKFETVDTGISGYNIEFIEYLRLTFLNSGFTAADQVDYPSLQAFQQKMAGRLVLI